MLGKNTGEILLLFVGATHVRQFLALCPNTLTHSQLRSGVQDWTPTFKMVPQPRLRTLLNRFWGKNFGYAIGY